MMDNAPMKLSGKQVLVTGAGRGIGAAIARALAREGAIVAVNYLSNEAAALDVVAQCRELGRSAGGDAWAVQADVRDRAQVTEMVARALSELGRIDAVVNNAFAPYVFDPDQRKRFWETDWAHYQDQFEGAVHAAYNVCQSVLPHFKQHRKHGL
jgi:3-oxoacyl-[acyl-carrier protein] reductase